MFINKYNLELNEDRIPVLVFESKESTYCDTVTSPEDVVSMLNEVFRLNRQAEEYVVMVALDNKGKPIGLFEVSHGTVSTSVAQPREIYLRALVTGAVRIILAHNHPSGSLEPSQQDEIACKRIKEAGDIIGIPLIDFIIIGEYEQFYSFNQQGLI